MSVAAIRPALLLLLALLAPPALSLTLQGNLAQPVSIAGEWRVQAGDQPDWAAPKFDDSTWPLTQVPAHSPQNLRGYAGLLWYRLHLQLDLESASLREQSGSLGITLGKVMSAYEVYAGGEKIGAVGSLPPTPVAIYDKQQTWAIPPSAISSDGELVLAMRVWRDPAIGEQSNTGPFSGDFLIGNIGQLREQGMRQAFWPNLVLASVYLAFGLYHLLIARRNPALTEFFWFGLLSLALAVYTFETSQSKFFIDIPFHWHKKLEMLVLFLSPVFLNKTLLTATKTADNRITHGFNLVFVLFFVGALFMSYQQVLRYALTYFQYLGVAWSIYIAGLMSWRAVQGSRSARGVIALLVLLVAAIINDAILRQPLLGSGNFLYIVFALILLFIALMMAERYTDILQRLEQAVSRRTAELVETNRELARAAETKSQFLTTVSHEMRTPMNAILGLAHLGLKTELDEQQRDYLTKLDQSAGDLQDIIDSILDFTKLQEGELECVERSFSLASVVEGLDRTWRGSIEDAGLEFALDIDPDLPAALVGDDKRIKQVLGNFLSNAVKFTEQGRVTLSLKLKERGDETVRLRFGVSDTGIGIAPDTHQQLFEAFAQADSSLTREYGGTGLGLPIARHLVELMGGSVEVESEPGRGSCFAFELELPLAEEGGGAGEAEAYIDLAPIMGGRVLLVDDSDLNLQVAGELLKQANLYVDVAHDGAQAVEMVLSHDYDCVLMDVQMPVMDGYAATREIRSRKKFASLPILAMTANALPQDRARGAEAGMNAYIPKPIDPDELYRSLLAWIEPGPRPFDVSDFASPPTNFDSPGGLPDQVAGINIADGLARVGGNSTLYLTLLADLCKDYDDAAQRIEVMLAGGDTDGSSQLAHKLRGIANNLGASALGDSAAKIEARLKSAEPLASDDLTRLAEAMELTRESQRQLAPPDQEQGAHSELDAVGRSDLFQELVQAVASNDPAAGDLAARLLAATTADDEIHDALSAAHDALDIYDFTTAAAQLESVAASMDG